MTWGASTFTNLSATFSCLFLFGSSLWYSCFETAYYCKGTRAMSSCQRIAFYPSLSLSLFPSFSPSMLVRLESTALLYCCESVFHFAVSLVVVPSQQGTVGFDGGLVYGLANLSAFSSQCLPFLILRASLPDAAIFTRHWFPG